MLNNHNSEGKIIKMGQFISDVIQHKKYCSLNTGIQYVYCLSLVQLWQDYYHMSVAVVIYCCGSVVVMYQFVLTKYTTVSIMYMQLFIFIMVAIYLLCSSGSVVVTYEVVVPKNESTVMQSNIITAIKKHSGSFAGSAIDGNYVSIAGKIFT